MRAIISSKTGCINQLGNSAYGLFSDPAGGISHTPFLPIYNLANEFLGLGRATVQGLVLFPMITSSYYDVAEDCHNVLKDFRIYTDIAQGTMSNSTLVSSYTLGADVKPVLAIPGDTCHLDINTLFLYNLESKKVLFLNVKDSDKDRTDFEEALPFIQNVKCTSDSIEVLVSDEPFSVNEAMGATEEKMFWELSGNASVNKNGKLMISSPSEEYRLICPQFKVYSIVVSSGTGVNKLSVYNLPVYNTLNIMECSTPERKINLFDSCRGTVKFVHNLGTHDNCALDITSTGSLVKLCLEYIKHCKLQLNECQTLIISRSEECSIKLNSAGKVTVKDTVLQGELHGDSFLLYSCSLDDSTISDARSIQMEAVTLSNVIFSNVYSILCDRACVIKSAEFRSVRFLALQGTKINSATLYADDNTYLDLTMHGKNGLPGTLDVHLSSDVLNFCYLLQYTCTVEQFREWIEDSVKYSYFDVDKRLLLDVHNCPSQCLHLVHTLYVTTETFENLSKVSINQLNYAPLLVLALCDCARLKLPQGTTCTLSIRLRPYTSDVAKLMRYGAVPYNDSPAEMGTIRLDVKTLAHEIKRCNMLKLPYDDFADRVLNLIEVLEEAGITSVDVEVFS